MGVVDKLPEHLKNRTTAEAITAPSAILLAGVGAAAAILGGLPLLAAAGIAAAAYGVRVTLRLPRKPRAERIELAGLSEPWRHFVREALDAQNRYERAVATTSAGPMRERLQEIGTRIDEGVRECYRIARRGAALEGGLSSLDAGAADRQLTALLQSLPEDAQTAIGQAQRAGDGIAAAAAAAGVDDNHVQTIEALEAQVASARRLAVVAQDARDRLSLLDARLDEAVARAVELSLRAADVAELGGLGGDVEALVGEMESLRVALEEVNAASRGAADGAWRPEAGGTPQSGTA